MIGLIRYYIELLFKGRRILKLFGTVHFVKRTWQYIKRCGWRSAIKPVDIDEQYQKWLNRDKVQSLSTGENSENSVHVNILISGSGVRLDQLEQVVTSVFAQNSPNWKLGFSGNLTEDPSIQGYIINLSKVDERIDLRLTDNSDSEHVLVVPADAILRVNAVSVLQRELAANPTADLIYFDEDKFDTNTGRRFAPQFKPDWSPHLVWSFNYIGSMIMVSRRILGQLTLLEQESDAIVTYDLVLRASELSSNILHITKVLYSKISANAERTKGQIAEKTCLLVKQALEKRGYQSRVDYDYVLGTCNVRIEIPKQDKVSIIIPTKNNAVILKQCIDSIVNKSTYKNYEVIVIDNGTTDNDAIEYMESLKTRSGFKVLSYPYEFNYPLINNFGAENAGGKHLVFLNDDTEVITPDWLEALIEYSQMPDVGAVGALLLFPNGQVQHAGIVVGMRGSASHAFYKSDGSSAGYLNLIRTVRDVSAVTAACLMIKAETFQKAGAFNPQFKVGLNDVDLCLRLLDMGLYNVYTPYAKLFHHESLTRGEYVAAEEIELFRNTYRQFIEKGDPFYHPELSLERNDFTLAV